MIASKIKLKHFTIYLDRPKLIVVRAIEDGEVELDELKQVIDASKQLASFNPYHSLLDLTEYNVRLSKEGIKYYKEYSAKADLKISQSVVYDSFGTGMVISSALYLVNLVSPHNFFVSYDKALKWIQSIDSEVV